MEKIKQFLESDKGKDVLTVIVVILVGLGSFMLGRLSKESDLSSGIKIEYSNQTDISEANAISSVNSLEKVSAIQNFVGKNFFASNRGSKFYSIGCSGGKTIKQENRIYFTTREEAEKQGYELSSSCR